MSVEKATVNIIPRCMNAYNQVVRLFRRMAGVIQLYVFTNSCYGSTFYCGYREYNKHLIWNLSHRADPKAKELADRHYNRQKPESAQFVPPGGCAVFYAQTSTGRAFWVTSTPFGQYVKHRWPGAWVCSAFRNENAGKACDMIINAMSASRFMLGDPPLLGMVTFIDRRFVKPIYVRGTATYGRTYILAGFEPDGETQGGLLAFRISRERFPVADCPNVSSDMVRVYDRMIAKRPLWLDSP